MTAIFAVLALLFPLGVYSLVLVALNRRSAPVLVRGAWDTIGLLFATSGFFLVTVPLLLSEFYFRTLGGAARDSFVDIWFRHWLVWLVYYLVLIAGSVYLILWRSHKTMIYNVDPDRFARLLPSLLAPTGLAVSVQNRRVAIGPAPQGNDRFDTEYMAGSPPPSPPDHRHVELEVEPFPTLCHVTLHWDMGEPELRDQIEQELRQGLESALPDDNPAAGWILSVSGLLFGMLIMMIVAVFFLLISPRRWE